MLEEKNIRQNYQIFQEVSIFHRKKGAFKVVAKD